MRLLIAASGTGGHLFPAIATARQLNDCQIEWLGVPNRLETTLVPKEYPLHTIAVEGFQQRLGLGSLKIAIGLMSSILQVRRLLKQGNFEGVFTTGGYIAGPTIIAARSLGLPVILHESNVLPGKVTRWLSRLSSTVALGFEEASQYLPGRKTVYVGTPVREEFLSLQPLDLLIPNDAPVIAIAGGSQGAVAINKLVRDCAPFWLEAGFWIVHQTGENDPDANSFQHPHYFPLPFYDNMAGLFQRANLVISRAGAGTLTELAITQTPSILIPYPYAAEKHQDYNANVFAAKDAALVFLQDKLTAEMLKNTVFDLLKSPDKLPKMAEAAGSLAVRDSGDKLADLVRDYLSQ